MKNQVRHEGCDGRNYIGSIVNVAEYRLSTETLQEVHFVGGSSHPTDDMTSVDQKRNESLADDARCAGEKNSHCFTLPRKRDPLRTLPGSWRF
jgi:hypothetical protein